MPLHRPRGRATDTRDPWLDNAKMILVTFVVIGHSWTMLRNDPLTEHLYSFLYAWHMPAFVLVSGYLSRSMEWNRARVAYAVRTLVVPYLLLETLLGLFRTQWGGEHLDQWFLHPHWPLWFLCALFVWRMITPIAKAVPAPSAIALAVAASVLIGWSSWQIFDVARVCGFMPFFVIGLCARKEHLAHLRGPAAQVAALAALAGVWWVTGSINEWARADWLYYNNDYAEFGISGWAAVGTRLAVLALGLVAALSFLALVPHRGGGWFTRMGTQSLVVYLFHGFFVREARYLDYPAWLYRHPELGFFATTAGAAAVALFLASPWISQVLGAVADPFGRVRQRLDAVVELAMRSRTPYPVPVVVPERESEREPALAGAH